MKNRAWILIAAASAALSHFIACGGSDTVPHDVTSSGAGGGAGLSGPGAGGNATTMATMATTVTTTGAGAGGNGGGGGAGGSGGGSSDCFANPNNTHFQIINACTDSDKVAKNPVLPLLNPDGSLPPLP